MAPQDRDRDDAKGEAPPPPPAAEALAGKGSFPPGYGKSGTRRAFVNPYMERISEYPDAILEGPQAEELRGRWRERWGVDRSGDTAGPARRGTLPGDPGEGVFLGVEIGCGNGFFLRGLCQRYPDRRYVGLEIRYKRVWMTARKLAQVGCTNAAVVVFHAGYLRRLFAPGELDAVYINHPDPWPKDRHARNRLIAPPLVSAVAELLAPGGVLEVKSDCARYADDLRRCAADVPLQEVAYTPDLHQPGEPLAEGNIETNYERKFREKGEPVFYMRLVRE